MAPLYCDITHLFSNLLSITTQIKESTMVGATDLNSSKDVVWPQMKECLHQFQCPNPMCKSVFGTQRGLSLHFRNSNNYFCNPLGQYRTDAEHSYTLDPPPQYDSETESLEKEENDVDCEDTSYACWSNGEDNLGDVSLLAQSANDMVALPDNLPSDDVSPTGFGLSYTNAQYVETSLAKLLNEIQAPKFMYSKVLHWAREAHTLGYNFIPRHGTKDSLLASLQLQLHLDHF